jgi:gamma-glutamyltranspeptidase/glutathione hydrolase
MSEAREFPFKAVRGDRVCGWLEQTRSEVLACNGVVATSQPLAAQAGLDILKRGGNAFDAAVAAAAVTNVVEPASAGIGGDLFVLAWLASEKRLIALNASGRAPSGATPQHLARRGFADRMPMYGIDTVTVPGVVDGWDVLLRRAGTMDFAAALEPAAQIAERGFAVSERIRNDWIRGAEVLARDAYSSSVYLPGGAPPQPFAVFRNPDLARTLRILQQQGKGAFYEGEIAEAIVARSNALGGTIRLADLAATRATWETPLCTRYRGHDIYEMPPSTQGFAVLQMMNILEACQGRFGVSLAELGPRHPQYWHLLVEAKKLAFADLYAHNADPGFADVPTERLISKDYAAQLCARIDPRRAAPAAQLPAATGGTVYLCSADRWGNMVSFIYSIYEAFGTGITVPGHGFVLNNRGALFSLDPDSPNVIAPGKRPFHTLLPGFVMRDGQPIVAFGLMGGSQQAQGHAQVLVDVIDLEANLQAASDAARFNHSQQTDVLALESSLHALVAAELRAMGHTVEAANGEHMGGFQGIRLHAGGVYAAASDHRKDGLAAGW